MNLFQYKYRNLSKVFSYFYSGWSNWTKTFKLHLFFKSLLFAKRGGILLSTTFVFYILGASAKNIR